jgi:hypothetical protein
VGGFNERVVSITRFDDEARRPIGDALAPDDISIPADVRDLALGRVRPLLAEQYERLVVGCEHPQYDCIIDVDRPTVAVTVDLQVETFIRGAGGEWYRVLGASEVVRKYYDGIVDEVRRRV